MVKKSSTSSTSSTTLSTLSTLSTPSSSSKKLLQLERGFTSPNKNGNRYCSQSSQNDLETASGLFPVSTSSSLQSNTWPVQTDPTFNQKITLKLSGVDNKCSYVMKNGNKPTHSCEFPKGQITWNDLSPYQSLISSYIHPDTPYRGVLAYHGLGSGKTLVGISVMCNFLQKDPQRTIVFLGKPSLRANFLKDLAKVDDSMLFNSKKSEEERANILKKKLVYVTFEEMANRLSGETPWNLDCNMGSAQQRDVSSGFGTLKGQNQSDSKDDPLFNNTLIIIDEAHNLVKQLSKPIYPDPTAAAVVLSAIRNARNVRLVFLTATPIQQDSYEIGVLLNLLIPSSFPNRFPEMFVDSSYGRNNFRFEKIDDAKTKAAFDAMFVGQVGANGNRQILNQEKFISIVQGLVSYYPVDFNYSQFARAVYHPTIFVPMTDVMLKKWTEKRREELNQSGETDLTCSLSSTDVAEAEDEDGGGIQKPKACASSFKSSNMTANNRPDIDQWEPRQFEEYAPKVPVVTKMVTERYDQGLGKQMIFVSTGDVAIYALTKYLQSNGWEYWDYETKVSSVLRKKYGDSFSKEVQKDTWCNSGKNDAFVELNLPTGTAKKGFVVLNGEINEAYKVKVLVQLFNSKTNIDGSRINLIILNTKYSEGLSLMTTTAVHILEPPRSMALLSQITARAIRMCSHVGLVYPDSWKVDIFRYMITRDDVFKTIDPLSYAGKKSLSAKETTSSHIALRADKAFGGDISLLADSEGGGQKKPSLSRKVSGGEERSPVPHPPPQKTKKLSGIEYLQNKCSERRGELECNAKDYCGFDEDTMQCKLLGTESSIFKVAKIKGDELETFLTLLRIASIDCAVFKSMHDPTKPVSCHMPIDSTSPGTELSSNARVVYDLSVETLKNDYSTEDVSECTMDKSQETCTASSKCTFHGNKCVPKCELLQSSSACTKEPMCRYDKGYLTSNCSPRFPLSLLESENSFGFSTKPHINNTFLKDVEVATMEISQIQSVSKELLEKMLHGTESLSPKNLMRRLQKFLEMEGYMPITDLVDKLIEIVKGRILKPIVTKGIIIGTRENWKDTNMFRVTTNVMRLMTMRKRDVMAFPSAYLLKTSFDPTLLLKKRVSDLHFVLHLNIEESEYFISSKEMKGLSINMAKLINSRQVLKDFVYADLSIYMAFFYSPTVINLHMTVVKRTDVFKAYGELPILNSAVPRVFTRVIGKLADGGKKGTRRKKDTYRSSRKKNEQ